MSVIEAILNGLYGSVMAIGFMLAIAAVFLLILCVQGFIDYIKEELHAVRGEKSKQRH